MPDATAEPVSLQKIAAVLVPGDQSRPGFFSLLFQMACFSGTPAHCRYTSQRYLGHGYAFVVLQVFPASTLWEL